MSISTLRRWDESGVLVAQRTPKGHRRYDISKINPNLLHGIGNKDRKTIAYARVSSHDQKDDLERQIQVLELYCAKQGWTYEIITNKQATHFGKTCGVARLAYNWALAEWQKQYEADKNYRDECQAKGITIDENRLNKPSQGKPRKQLNAIKREKYPFMLEVTKCSPQEAII